MRAVEFYTTPEGEVTVKERGLPERQLNESDVDFIQPFLEVLEEFYTEAYEALRKEYSRYDGNRIYRDFLATRRFIKCNFGLYDNEVDIDENWNFRFEFVSCPLRGECKYFKKICQPKFNSKLSDRQLEIMRLCYEGVPDDDIADRMFLSIHTINNHRRNSFKKLGLHSMAEFNRYAAEKGLFKSSI
ncbi:MAG: helix-turn-helix transcriptional regulator [Parabacteroides gordonii]|nr:helix-turn-helix transcriptional regulator [Parabacteroides gordonii]